jgi:hypothetical protein
LEVAQLLAARTSDTAWTKSFGADVLALKGERALITALDRRIKDEDKKIALQKGLNGLDQALAIAQEPKKGQYASIRADLVSRYNELAGNQQPR